MPCHRGVGATGAVSPHAAAVVSSTHRGSPDIPRLADGTSMPTGRRSHRAFVTHQPRPPRVIRAILSDPIPFSCSRRLRYSMPDARHRRVSPEHVQSHAPEQLSFIIYSVR